MTGGWQPIGARPARVGLIGLGAMGRNHLRLLSAREDVELVAISDPLPEVLEAATATTDATGYADPQEMLATAGLDAVVVASPTTTHLVLGLAAVGRGIATLIEKPLAATPDEAGYLVTASAETGVPIQVGHVERFNPAVLELGRLLDGRLALDRLFDRQPAGGPIPGTHPRRRGDDRPRHARRRHPLVRRRPNGRPASRPRPRSASTRATRTCCSACCRSRRARSGCSTSTG